MKFRRTFWKTSIQDRKRGPNALSSQGVVASGSSVWALDSSIGELAFFKNSSIDIASISYVAELGDGLIPYNVAQQAGVDPWYDSYDQYSQDVSKISKDCSILPEFRISEHLDYYVHDNDLNFDTLPLENFLSIEGINGDSSGSNFYQSFSHSDFIKNFSTVEKDNGANSNKEIRLSVKGVKKLLPYNGFYPVIRTTQLASIFSSSLAGHSVGGFSGISSGSADYSSLLTLFFKPGIMYNTIKSGIAVSIPCHSASITQTSNGIATPADYRVPFEAIISPKYNLREKNPIYYGYGFDYVISSTWDGQKNNILYELASNNFFAESTKFFLKNESAQVFSSAPENEFEIMTANVPYFMDINLYKSSADFVMFDGQTRKGSPFAMTVYSGSYGVSSPGGAESRFLAATPPYFYGKSTARLSFTPSETRKYSTEEILSGISASFFNNLEFNNAVSDLVPGSAASSSIMSIDSSINFKGKTTLKQIQYKTENSQMTPIQANDVQAGAGLDVWVISPKFETPIFDFSGENTSSVESGMWVNYRDSQTGSAGIYLELADPFSEATKAINPTTGSLMEVCKFDFKQPAKKLGQLADSKEISEAVVAIPFKRNGERYHFSQDTLAMLKNPNSAKGGVPPGDSLKDMFNKMQNYVFPPHLDFLNNSTVQPFGMYIFEFKHTLSKKDLAKIWQGVMPEIATKAELDEVSIQHPFAPGEVFSTDFDANTRWLIFKVKKRAANNYYATTADSKDDTRFDFNFKIGGKKLSTKEDILPYSYNYPYDFFSLVELAKVEAEIIYTKKK